MAFEEKEKNGLPVDEPTGSVSENAELLDEVIDLDDEPEIDITEPVKKERKFKLPKITFKRDARRLRVGAAATVFTVVVVAAIFLLNIIVGIVEDRWPITIDTTQNQIYTLSDQASEYAGSVDKEIEIVVCADESTLTSPNTGMDEFNNMYLQLHAALESFQSLSGGKITVKYLDLNEQPLEAATYTELGATSGSVVIVCGENSRVLSLTEDFTDYTMDEVYMYYYYYGQSVSVNSTVETALVTGINAVSGEKLAGVTILTGHSADENVISALSQLLTKRGYTVEQVDITTMAEISADSTLMVIPAPSEDYSEEEIKRIREWVENDNTYGHHLMVAKNPVGTTPNIDLYVEDTFGIEITDDIIYETSYSYIYSGNQSPIYSYADVAATDYASATRVLAPINAHLKVVSGDSQEITPLYTFPESALLYNLADAEAQNEGETYEPVAADSADYPLVGAALSSIYSSNGDTHGLVFGSNSFLQAATSLDANEELTMGVLNAVLGGDEILIELEDKALSATDTLTVDSAGAALIVFVIFVILVPVATLVVCLLVFLKRRRL